MNRKMLAVGLAALAGTAVSANARPAVFSSGFETAEGYVAGAGPGGQLFPGAISPGQNGWLFFSSSISASNPHVIADSTKAYQGTNYLEVQTGSSWGSSTSSRSTFSYHQDAVAAGLLAGNVLHVSVAMRIENIAAATRTTGMTMFSYGSAAILGGVRLQSNGIFAIFNGAGVGIGLGGAANDTWYRFDEYFDFAQGKAFFFINGIDQSGVLDGAGFSRAFTATDYAETDLVDSRFSSTTGAASQGHVHRWDSLSIDYGAAPAPGSAALLGLAGVLTARRRRS